MTWSAGDLLWERRRRQYRGGSDVDSQLDGFAAWCADHVKILRPGGKVSFELRPQQRDTARSYLTNDRTLILKARQIGFTTLTLNFALWRALFWPDYTTIILSRKEDDAVSALGMATMAYDQLSADLKARLPVRRDNNLSKITFDNGSRIESHPSANNPARGRTADLMVLDEWAFMPNPEDAWASVEPVTDVGGRIIALSTANGWGNLFHQMWQGAVKGDNNFHSIFYPWSAVPGRDDAWYASKSKDLLPWQMAQEYPSNPEEAFIKSGNPVFDVDVIRRLKIRKPDRGSLYSPSGNPRSAVWKPASDGPLAVWELPQPMTSYVLGADTAAGLEHGDYSSAHVIRVDTGMVVAHWHGHADPDVFGKILAALGWWFRTALAGVESNMHGSTVIQALKNCGYERIYLRRNYGSRGETMGTTWGWHTHKASKPMMIDALAAGLRDASIGLHDRATQQELLVYVRKADGSTEGSPHDDRVISLALATVMLQHAYSPEQEPAPLQEEFTFSWWLDQAKSKPRSSEPIGAFNIR